MYFFSGKRPSKKIIAQYRSWKIMEDYFGIKQYASQTWGNINWRKILTKEMVSELDNLIKKRNERWEEMAKLN